MKCFYVYIMASRKNGTLYIGITNDVVRRTWEHRNGQVEGFTKKYNVRRLVYVQQFVDAPSAIKMEKKLKNWRRQYKIELIESVNPDWNDLYPQLLT